MTPLWRSIITSTLFFIFFCPNVTARQTPAKREVVGIALSGGGALGIAHVGVLRYLEEQRIPIDVIAGTSMGGLLGGLYATGHSVDDLERIVRTADWDDLLRSTPRFEDVSVSEKQEWNRVTGVYSIPLRTGLALPEGINTGQALVRLLSGETAAYWDVDDFDNLPIPFRCVATDLMSGEAVVLGEGRLPEALRATMAIPGIFTPVEWNSRLLVDGGLVNNLPADVAKDMGADTIIAVTLRLPDPNTQDLQSLPSVVRQTMNIAVVQNERRNLSIVDIEIAVRIPGRGGLMDFRAAEILIKAGYEAAAGHSAALGKLALSQEQWAEHIRNRKSKERSLPSSGPL
ncbi:MAG TPA: patatin-like phospholipase family protein, partial [Terriglobia bacterium]|nr:patatin-like phospholipase family protein [Terriglobia bacterium]